MSRSPKHPRSTPASPTGASPPGGGRSWPAGRLTVLLALGLVAAHLAALAGLSYPLLTDLLRPDIAHSGDSLAAAAAAVPAGTGPTTGLASPLPALDSPARQESETLADLGMALLVTLIMLLEALRLGLAVVLSGPLAALGRHLEAAAAGAFDRLAGPVATDEIGRLLDGLNRRFAAVNRRYFALGDRLAAARGEKAGAAGEKAGAWAKLGEQFRFARTPARLPAYDRQGMLVRLILFLFIGADAFSASFLPVYTRQIAAGSGLSEQLAASLPISAFWLMVAAAQFTANRWDRAWRPGWDRRRTFAAALLLATLGLVMAGVAGNLPGDTDGLRAYGLTLGRALGGFGYGAAMILAQDQMMRAAAAEARTRASGSYLSIFFGGTICGTVIGSLLADRLGPAATILVSAAVCAAALPLTPALDAEPAPDGERGFQPARLLRNGALISLVVFAAIPSRLLISAFLYYLVPLHLHDLGASKPMTGRIMMIYALIMTLTTPLWSALIDRLNRPLLFTMAGLALSGAAMLVIPLASSPDGGFGAVMAAIALLGTAQAMGMSPQITVLFRIAPEEVAAFGQTTVLGLYRVCERIGLVAGPLAMAWLVDSAGTGPALGLLAAVTFAASLALGGRLALPARTGGATSSSPPSAIEDIPS